MAHGWESPSLFLSLRNKNGACVPALVKCLFFESLHVVPRTVAFPELGGEDYLQAGRKARPDRPINQEALIGPITLSEQILLWKITLHHVPLG